MNLNPLYELRERLAANAVSGVGLIFEDFRLKRAVEQASSLSQASPVFQNINKMAEELLNPDCTIRCQILLDTLALLDAVLCTQAVTDAGSDLKPIPVTKGTFYADTPYSQLAPLITALTSTGGGRFQIIQTAMEDNPKLLRDYRLKEALVGALGDSYSETAEIVEKWMKQEDETFLPFLKQGLDPKGKKDMVRRIHVMEAIAGEKENDYYIKLLDDAEKEVRCAAIIALRHSKGNEALLLDLCKTEKGNAKKSAQFALSFMDSAETKNYWSALLKKPQSAAELLRVTNSNSISDLVAEAMNSLIDTLLLKHGHELTEPEYNELTSLVFMMPAKSSAAMCQVYLKLAKNSKKIAKLTWKDKLVKFSDGAYGAQYPITDILQNTLIDSVFYAPNKEMKALAKELFDSCQYHEYLPAAFLVSLMEDGREEVYERFSAKINSLLPVFSLIHFQAEEKRYVICRNLYYPVQAQYERALIPLVNGLDPRWFPLFTDDRTNKKEKFSNLHYNGYVNYESTFDDMISRLINPDDPYTCKILGEYFLQRAKSIGGRSYAHYLSLCRQKHCVGVLTRYLESLKNFSGYHIVSMMQELPLSTEEKLQELELISRLVERHPKADRSILKQQIQFWSNNLREGRVMEG